MPRRLFRIVKQDPPRLQDFLSHAALGVQPRRPLSSRDLDRWRGVSIYSSRSAARGKATDSPWLGSYVAELSLPDNDARLRLEQTGRDREHYTIWAEPALLLSFVTIVTPVEALH